MSHIALLNYKASTLRIYVETSNVSIISEQPSYIATSSRVDNAPPIWERAGTKAKGISIDNQWKGGSGLCTLWGGLDRSLYIVPIALLVRVQYFRKKSVQGCRRGHEQGLLSLRWSLGHTFDVEVVLLFLSPTRRNSLHIWPFLVCILDYCRIPD